jgi:hypothetical protein
MTKTLNTTFAAALLAASVFGASATLAAPSGDYFPGGVREPAQTQNVDAFRTNSIGGSGVLIEKTASDDQRADRGEYRSVAPVNVN